MRHDPVRPVRRWLRAVAPRRRTFKADVLAGLPRAIGSVPDGMAASVLTGVNPIHGLYASFAGPIAGGLSASTKLMVITTTSAAALAAGSAVGSLSPEDRPAALFLLTLMAGAAMIAAGLLRLGRFARFVSHSVMMGFLSGVAVNIIAGQIPDLTGAVGEGSVAIQKAWDVVTHPGQIELASVLAGAGAIVIILLLSRTRIATFSAVVALTVPTVVVLLVGADVAQVKDEGDIPSGIPLAGVARALRVLAGRSLSERWQWRQSCSSRASASPNQPRTRTVRVRTRTSTSWPRAWATWAPASSRASPSAARSARPP